MIVDWKTILSSINHQMLVPYLWDSPNLSLDHTTILSTGIVFLTFYSVFIWSVWIKNKSYINDNNIVTKWWREWTPRGCLRLLYCSTLTHESIPPKKNKLFMETSLHFQKGRSIKKFKEYRRNQKGRNIKKFKYNRRNR